MKIRVSLTILIIPLLLGCIDKKNTVNDWESYNLKGKVKSFRQKVFKIENKFGELTKDGLDPESLNDYIVFNEKGYLKFIERYDYRGDLKEKYIYNYRDDDNLIEWKRVVDGELKINRIYDENGLITKEIQYSNEGNILTEKKFDYDGNGNKIKYEIDYRKFNEDWSGFTLYTYDDEDYLIQENEFDENEDQEKIIKYENDSKGKILLKTEYRKSNFDNLSKTFDIVSVTKFKYGNNGEKIESVRTGKGGTLKVKEIFRYNENEDLVEEVHYNSKNEEKFRETKSYDEKGNIYKYYIDDKYLLNRNENIERIFVYDEKGNIVQSTVYKNDLPTYIIENEFEYY